MRKLANLLLTSLLICGVQLTLSQSYQQKLCSIFPDTSGPTASVVGNFQYQTTFSNSGSMWEIDWNESEVFHNLITYSNPNNPYQSFELRMGKGGQVYSFKSNGFGEALPPQWRPSFDSLGASIANPGTSSPVKSHHGNWAPWNDEVWQLVASDQNDSLGGQIKTQNIHQGGSYMNNYTHRESDLVTKPFYSPEVQYHFDSATNSYSSIYWGQSENPAYAYDSTSYCDSCFEDPFRPSVLYFQRYKNLSEGVIQVDYIIYNFHPTRAIDYWNVPFTGIRNSSLPFAFISNSATNELTYEALNTKAGHPSASDPTSYLPQFNQGAARRTSGNLPTSSGWYAFSTDSAGNGPSLAFITAKSSSSPVNGYGDIRYGTAMNNPLRDVSIFTRRAIGGARDATTGLKPWGIVGGQSIKGRYFIVLDSSINDIVQQIQTKNLVTHASIEKVIIGESATNNIHYTFTQNSFGAFIPLEIDSLSAIITLNSKPFTGSYPAFLITTNTESIITSNPYHYSLKPYDGNVTNIELLGFSSLKQNVILNPISISELNKSERSLILYPNPATHLVTCIGSNFEPNNFQVFNLIGQNVLPKIKIESISSEKITLDISNLKTGIYLIKTESGIGKFIKTE